MPRKKRSKENILNGGGGYRTLSPSLKIFLFRIFHCVGSMYLPIQTYDARAFMLYNSADSHEKK